MPSPSLVRRLRAVVAVADSSCNVRDDEFGFPMMNNDISVVPCRPTGHSIHYGTRVINVGVGVAILQLQNIAVVFVLLLYCLLCLFVRATLLSCVEQEQSFSPSSIHDEKEGVPSILNPNP